MRQTRKGNTWHFGMKGHGGTGGLMESLTSRDLNHEHIVVASVIPAHNHPSGDPNPSTEELMVTRQLREAGIAIGIEVLDHIVVGDPGRYYSFREAGRMESGSTGRAGSA